MPLSLTQLEFLSNLPTLLNSSLQISNIVGSVTRNLCKVIEAEAATVFLLDDTASSVSFWILEGDSSESLLGKKMPANEGVVGWVITNQKPTIVNDTKSDSRFYRKADDMSGFETKSLLCTPLTLRGEKHLGALQVLNKTGGQNFSENDLDFLDRVAHQVALAIENANLYNRSQALANNLTILNQRKDDMLSILSHELRTPLNLIESSVELLLEESLDDNTKNAASEIVSNGISRLNSLAGSLRNASLLKEKDTFKPTMTPVPLAEILQVLDNEFSTICKNRNLRWSCPDLKNDLVIKADRTLILIALRNLISNAVRFTPNEGEICLLIKKGLGVCELIIKDTGIGIDINQQSIIFEKFYEVGDVLSHSSGKYEFRSAGLGLGLSSAKEIINAHGSEISLLSEIDKGSTFSFTLKTN